MTNEELKVYIKGQIEYYNDIIQEPVQMFPDDESYNNYINCHMSRIEAYEDVLSLL